MPPPPPTLAPFGAFCYDRNGKPLGIKLTTFFSMAFGKGVQAMQDYLAMFPEYFELFPFQVFKHDHLFRTAMFEDFSKHTEFLRKALPELEEVRLLQAQRDALSVQNAFPGDSNPRPLKKHKSLVCALQERIAELEAIIVKQNEQIDEYKKVTPEGWVLSE